MSPRFSRLVFAALVIAGLCWSQTNFGRISGSVADSSGASIPNCVVTVTNPDTGLKQTETDTAGIFVFPSLPAGTYNLRFEHTGFRSAEQNGVVLDGASSRDFAMRLEVGQLTESVSVSAASEQVQTTSGGVGRVISETQVSQLALNGREYTQLLRLTALERAGDFRGSTLAAPVDPTTNAPYPDRVVPQSAWSKNGPLPKAP
jgi:hypothetical protein